MNDMIEQLKNERYATIVNAYDGSIDQIDIQEGNLDKIVDLDDRITREEFEDALNKNAKTKKIRNKTLEPVFDEFDNHALYNRETVVHIVENFITDLNIAYERIDELIRSLQQQNQTIAANKASINQLEKTVEEYRNLDERVIKLNEKTEEIATEIKTLENHQANLSQTREDLELKNEELDAEIKDLQNSNDIKTEQVNELRQQLKDTTTDFNTLSGQHDELKQKYKELDAQKEKLSYAYNRATQLAERAIAMSKNVTVIMEYNNLNSKAALKNVPMELLTPLKNVDEPINQPQTVASNNQPQPTQPAQPAPSLNFPQTENHQEQIMDNMSDQFDHLGSEPELDDELINNDTNFPVDIDDWDNEPEDFL